MPPLTSKERAEIRRKVQRDFEAQEADKAARKEARRKNSTKKSLPATSSSSKKQQKAKGRSDDERQGHESNESVEISRQERARIRQKVKREFEAGQAAAKLSAVEARKTQRSVAVLQRDELDDIVDDAGYSFRGRAVAVHHVNPVPDNTQPGNHDFQYPCFINSVNGGVNRENHLNVPLVEHCQTTSSPYLACPHRAVCAGGLILEVDPSPAQPQVQNQVQWTGDHLAPKMEEEFTDHRYEDVQAATMAQFDQRVQELEEQRSRRDLDPMTAEEYPNHHNIQVPMAQSGPLVQES